MQCPFCGQDNDKVIDSRSSDGGRVIRRRRQCLACSRRYTTYERPEEAIRLNVIKKDGSREPYDRQKIIDGLTKATYKRPVTDDQMRQIVDGTEESIFRAYDKEVPSTYIGDLVSERLRQVDQIAYVRFASVYRNFADLGQLIEEAAQTPRPSPEQKKLF